MRLRNLDLFLALGIAVLNVVWAIVATTAGLANLTAISTILALPLIFVLPGYTLTEALFKNHALEIVQLLVFTIALSLAVSILSGFALNLLPTGLHTLPWAVWLGTFTAIFALIAYFRRRAQPLDAQPWKSPFRLSTSLLSGLAILVMVLSVVYSVIGAEQQSHQAFTNLWLLPTTQAGNTCAVSFGVQSFEAAPVNYHIVVTINNAPTASWPSILLAPKQQWTHVEPITVTGGTLLVVQVQLYRANQPQVVYRHVDLTLHIASKGGTKYQCTTSFISPPALD